MWVLTRIAILGALPLLAGGCAVLKGAPTNYAAVRPTGPALDAVPIASAAPSEFDLETEVPAAPVGRASRRLAAASSGIDPQAILDASARARGSWTPLDPSELDRPHPPKRREPATAAMATPTPAKANGKGAEPDRLAPNAVPDGKGYDSDALYQRLEGKARKSKPICSGC